jgi:hypothetical protein
LLRATRQTDGTVPLVLVRRWHIIKWLEACFHHVLPPGATRPRDTRYVRNLGCGLPDTDKDEDLMRASLALILAGRLHDAQQLMRDSGVPWRAASLGGEAPHGYDQHDGEITSVGNESRPLWRWVMWKYSEKLNGDVKALPEEAAIVALLSNHVKNSLENIALRSWEKGLYVTLRSVLGRMEDSLLHMHNNNRRQCRPPFPGTQYAEKELEHLRDTSDIASLDEAEIVNTLESSPFEEMQTNDYVTGAMSQILIGKDAIVTYLRRAVQTLHKTDANDKEFLGFITHLLIYFDSLSNGAEPVILDNVAEWKNDALVFYLEFLSSREDLWYMIVLYASLLPESAVVVYLPQLFAKIESNNERAIIVDQLCEHLPGYRLDIAVLQLLVTSVLLELDTENDGFQHETPSDLDVRKMNSLSWLYFRPEHIGDALICCNTLLRQFLLEDKFNAALMLLEQVRRDFVVDKFLESPSSDGDSDDQLMEDIDHVINMDVARSEYHGFQCYLDALKAVRFWQETLVTTEAEPQVLDSSIDTSRLNITEAEIASLMERRNVIHEKRKSSLCVNSVADDACRSLKSVLEYPSGWLLTDNETGTDQSDEATKRREELLSLRGKLLPGSFMKYVEVCMDTASWMSTSLDDALVRLEGEPQNLLGDLDGGADGMKTPLSPCFWTAKALEIAEVVANEQYGIIGDSKSYYLHDLLQKLAEASVEHMFYTSKYELE